MYYEWHSPEWWEWWKSLDHTMCTHLITDRDANAFGTWETCRSAHCDECGRSTGWQGHKKKVGEEWVCPNVR